MIAFNGILLLDAANDILAHACKRKTQQQQRQAHVAAQEHLLERRHRPGAQRADPDAEALGDGLRALLQVL